MNLKESAAVVFGSMVAGMIGAFLCGLVMVMLNVGTLHVRPDSALHVALGAGEGVFVFMVLMAIMVIAGWVIGVVLGLVNLIIGTVLSTFTERWQRSLLFAPMCIAAFVLWSAGISGGDAGILLVIAAASGLGAYVLPPYLLQPADEPAA